MNPYKNIVLDYVPKILSLLDRDEDSPTYGCFDRNHWHYKIRDFPSAILQQSCLVLAHVYSTNFEGNTYYKNQKIRNWAIASIRYWASIQHRDGSFDEYWPNEHGYPPTVFSTYAVSEACRLLKYSDDKIEKSLLKSVKFILKKEESGAVNQEIASITAIYSVYLTTRHKKFLPQMKKKLKKVLNTQTAEGWFPEYGGADIGYLSVSLHFLIEYYRLSKDKIVFTPIKKTLDFIQYFVHPDGTSGGDYGSRNTQYFLRGGLEFIAERIPVGGAIADKLLEQGPNTIDERYMEHYCLHALTTALINHKKRKHNTQIPCQKDCEKHFPKAGLYVKKEGDIYMIVNLNKGGVIKIYKDKKNIVNDCGYRIWQGQMGVTNWVDPSCRKKVKQGSLEVNMYVQKAKFFVPTPIKHTLLRIASAIAGSKIIPVLKNIMISPANKHEINFKRKIIISKSLLIIKDLISSKHPIDKIKSSDGFSIRYVPSSKYFQLSELDQKSKPILIKNKTKVVIEKRIHLNKNTINITTF